jgi:uncharacterized protein (DUF433 family)
VEVLALLANPNLAVELGGQTSEDTDPEPIEVARQHQVRLSPARVDELALAYQRGATVQELVEQFGVHRTTVLNHLKRRDVARRANIRKLTDEQVQEAARYYRAGNSLVTTGKRFGVDGTTIARELRQVGVGVRRRRGWK